jgi:glyoxylase-like metal-dependent hydrolase (beta-lactamase superfamily II)
VTTPTITPFVLGDYQTNCFVVTAHAPNQPQDCTIIDCGLEPHEMFHWIDVHKLRPTQILLTHSHLDHIAGVDQALSRYGNLPIAIHEDERGFCSDPMLNLSALIGMPITCTEPGQYLTHNQIVDLNGSTWRVLHTPGHSPGGACFVHEASKQAIVGDTLFAGSIGRYDFPTSDAADLRRSLHEVLMKLPDDMTIYPGHGPRTTIGKERRTNPYIVGGF